MQKGRTVRQESRTPWPYRSGHVRRLRPVGALAVAAAAIALAPTANSAGAETVPCAQWTKQPVAAGYGVLENLAFDGRGGLLLSEQSLTGPGGALQRLTSTGARSAAVSDLDGPGGIVVHDNIAYFTTGNTAASALANRSDGTIRTLNLDTGAVETVVTGLTMPNGLAQLPDGSFVVSKDIGGGSLTRISADGTAAPYAPSLTSTNGLAYDPARRRLIVSTTFDPATVVASVDVDDPDAAVSRNVIPGFGPLNSADDLTVGPDSVAYVALNAGGAIVRIDPATGVQCRIADGLPLSSSVRFGSGPGWDPNALYVTSFLGTVTKLVPPQSN